MRVLPVLLLASTLPAFSETMMDPALAQQLSTAGCVVSEKELMKAVKGAGLERTFSRQSFFDLFSNGELLPISMVHKGYARPDGYFELISKYTGEGQLNLFVIPPQICNRPAITSSPTYNAFLIDGLLENAQLYQPQEESIDPEQFPLLRAVVRSLESNGCALSLAPMHEVGYVSSEKDLQILGDIAKHAGITLGISKDIDRLLELALFSDQVYSLSDHRRPILEMKNDRLGGRLARVFTLLTCKS